ncbi:hypothetical protein [Maridesulfovibrio sp.]|uniref:hypothetical protein n=1 Tax=Maridesulfovibrio sp. TaxID=2795000 RepID=UPI0029F56187|nr:hypothetical protein [Maridesulfovibrio sp.]
MNDISKLPIEVVLICDPISDESEEIDHLSSDGDRPDPSSLELIFDGLLKIAEHVTHYRTIEDFINNINCHRKSVVFPYWFGEISRNRHSLVPAICESYGISYIGADAYTKAVCNDKHLAKTICEECRIPTPSGFILTEKKDLQLLSSWTYPAVIKPICQGSSLGISEKSLAQNEVEAREVAISLAKSFGWPVLVEEMLIGREISICIMGNHIDEPYIKALSWTINGQPDFLNERLFTYALKYLDNCDFLPVDESQILTESLVLSCKKLFQLLDKAEIIRIDGRITKNGFYAFELSPDLDLRPDGELAMSFGQNEYPCLLRKLITNALERAGRKLPADNKN